MLKIIVLPGVGFNEYDKTYHKFVKTLQEKTGADVGFFNWMHDSHCESHCNKHIFEDDNLRGKFFRIWVSEIILDFQSVILKSDKIKMPEAEIYIGHSAGSILALNKRPEKKIISMGSPAHLISTDFKLDRERVLNIVHKNDPIAYPIEGVENFFFDSSILGFSKYFPLSAHSEYWKSKKVIDKILKQINKWEKN